MTQLLRAEIEDPDCVDNQVWQHTFAIDTDWKDIITTVRLLYPEASSVYLYAVEAEEDAEE